MKKKLILIVSVLLCAGYASGAAEPNPWAAYRYAPDALREIDLASDKDWTLSVDGGAPRPIKVTAGGWNSDQQEPQIPSADVKDYAVYERQIAIPSEAKDQVVKILFGGCNYGAEVYLDDQKITEHHAPMTPFEADVTAVAKPGQTQRLKVKAYSRFHYGERPNVPVGFDFNKGMCGKTRWDTKYAYGLTGYVRLALYPSVHIRELFVRPSVSGKSLAYDVWVANASGTEREVILKGGLSSWDKRTWSYPALPDRTVRLAPGEVRKVTIEGVPWTLGPESYWWPNIPFREDYSATLHWLKLTLAQDGKVLHQRQQRFGFVEYQEGPFYYTVNGVRFTSFSDTNSFGQVGEYDCWTETPCFQPPALSAVNGLHGEFKGCPETWKRYQRIGFNSMRLSTSVPTPYMLETADEAGYMLIPEGGSWGNNTCKFDKSNFGAQLQALIRVARNHPSVARYSTCNESLPKDFASPKNEWRWLIDSALEVDATRPLVCEVNPNLTGRVTGMNSGHAFLMEHYMPVVRDEGHLRGMGECAWTTDGMAPFAYQALEMRLKDWAHFAPWSWVNFWPNFLEGMNTARHPWLSNNYGDRHDGVDGWGSPIVQAVQWALHPYLVIDRGLLELNPRITESSKVGKVGWPYRTPVYAPGAKIERPIEVFNNALAGGTFTLNWSAHWDSPAGPEVGRGAVGPFKIEAGFHTTQTVAFEAPKPDREERTLYLVLESVKDGKVVCHDEHSRLTVTTKTIPASVAAFVGADETTRGDWQGKYGKEGSWLAGRGPRLSAYFGTDLMHFSWGSWAQKPTEPQALADDGGKRSACYWWGDLSFVVDVGPAPRKVSFYFLDWDDAGKREQTVSMRAVDGRVLDERTVGGFQQGKYLSWTMQGRVKVEMKQKAGKFAVFSGVFVD
ncbi:MAG: sugar-binding domain-containing protein [Verrucomicrobiota bacterium]